MTRSAPPPRAANSVNTPDRTTVPAALPVRDVSRQPVGLVPVPAENGELRKTERLAAPARSRATAPGQHESQRPGRAAGSQDRDLLAVQVDAGLTEVQHRARGVGGGSHQPVPLPVEGVDASGEAGLLAQAVEMFDDCLFVRDRHIGAEETHAAQAGDDVAQGLGRAREGDVAGVQTRGLDGGVVHHRRHGMLHRPSQDSQKFRGPVDHDSCTVSPAGSRNSARALRLAALAISSTPTPRTRAKVSATKRT